MMTRNGINASAALEGGEKDSIYNCDADNIVTLKNDYGKGTTLASVGKSQSDLP